MLRFVAAQSSWGMAGFRCFLTAMDSDFMALRSAEGKRGVDATHHFEMHALDGEDGRLIWKQEVGARH